MHLMSPLELRQSLSAHFPHLQKERTGLLIPGVSLSASESSALLASSGPPSLSGFVQPILAFFFLQYSEFCMLA